MTRKAFSLLELIVSIVVIGIVAASFPMILSRVSDNAAFAIQQEAVMATKTYISTILSYPWDSNSVGDISDTGSRAMVLDTDHETQADDAFRRIENTNLRIGHIEGEGRRRLFDRNNILAKPSNVVVNDIADIDDFNGQNLFMAAVPQGMDSILDLTLTASVQYVPDGANYEDDIINGFIFNTNGNNVGAGNNGITNIKLIEVNTHIDQYNKNIVLRAYSANIGEFVLLGRGAGEW